MIACLPAQQFVYLPVCKSGWLPVRPEPLAQGFAPLDLRLRTLPLPAARAGSINQSTALFPLPGTFASRFATRLYPVQGHPPVMWAVRPGTRSGKKDTQYQCGRVNTLLEVVA